MARLLRCALCGYKAVQSIGKKHVLCDNGGCAQGVEGQWPHVWNRIQRAISAKLKAARPKVLLDLIGDYMDEHCTVDNIDGPTVTSECDCAICVKARLIIAALAAEKPVETKRDGGRKPSRSEIEEMQT